MVKIVKDKCIGAVAVRENKKANRNRKVDVSIIKFGNCFYNCHFATAYLFWEWRTICN